MSDFQPTHLSALHGIAAILGTTKTHIWPFFENSGIRVVGMSASATLIPSETGGSAEALEDDFSPILGPGGLYSYVFDPSGNHHLAGGDHNDLSFTTGAFSVGAMVMPFSIASNTILAKYDSAGNKEEYRFWIDAAGLLTFEIQDASESATEIVASGDAIPLNRPELYVATFDGVAATPAMNLYRGSADLIGGPESAETSAFAAMENTTAPLTIGCSGVTATPVNEFHGLIGLPFIVGKELDVNDIRGLYQNYKAIFGL